MDTEEEVVRRLEAAGYVHHFVPDAEGLRCPECETVADPRMVTVDETVRFEGSSSPGDESVVFAITNGPCGHRGTLVAAYGPNASPDEAEVVRTLGQEPADDPITAREGAELDLMEADASEAGAELGDEMP
ncbi:MAG: hypothetical protein ABWZ89_01880 [Acidimicrobiales bacterium]